MSNRMKMPKAKKKVSVEATEEQKKASSGNTFLADKKAKSNMKNNFTGKSSKAFSKKKT